MVYHEVGDVYADFRGGSDIPTACVGGQDDNLAGKVCTQDKPVSFKIKGPVRDSFDL
ncbi:hypothetical protein NW762_005441 [Fusarium torreyae]|uniref:AA1-like domain-containing protein n=1 Tax=Fusarium torreyae TaxID=1237075 RepID=A0A9W8VFV3_9HYPO|nr:hypothetical protein NW762_005441 [Fusarium torreyae]